MDIRGECGFSSLMKQNKKAKICFVICFAGFFFLKKFCYEVFAKQKKRKESSKYYWRQGSPGLEYTHQPWSSPREEGLRFKY